MQVTWDALAAGAADALDGTWLEIDGWFLPAEIAARPNYFILTDEAACCGGCLPADPARRVEVFAAQTIDLPGEAVRLAGRWRVLQDDPAGWRYQLHEARLIAAPRLEAAGFTRRGMLAAGAALTLSAWTPKQAKAQTPATVDLRPAREAIADTVTIDLHSHGGAVIGRKRVVEGAPFQPLAEPMRQGGMAVACLSIVADTPVTEVTADRRIKPSRDPAPGELHAFAEKSFARLHALVAEQKLEIITDLAGLRAARAERPSVIVASEGADFLEGQIDRVDEAFTRWKLRHLQLTHYRVNELGDIQTEARVHDGLTKFGAEVIRRCNQLGIVVDVAHGTYDLVKQAAKVTTKPLVISHTSYVQRPGSMSRQISEEHARVIANTGGMIGFWPPTTIFPDLAALAEGIGKLADKIGVDFVGLGSDMMGLLSQSALPSYRDLPDFAAALLARGFNAEEVRKILGGNYLRVFQATMA
jgi:membrane dipeptidase